MAKALQLDVDILDNTTPIPKAAFGQVPVGAALPSFAVGKKGHPKVGQIPLQVRWPRNEVKAAKLAAVELDFPTMSDFMLACFHEYMKTR